MKSPLSVRALVCCSARAVRHTFNGLLAALAQRAAGMRFVIRSPLEIGSQKKTSLSELCRATVPSLRGASAVNLLLTRADGSPKGQ
jgi:hypothetical protein